MTISASKTINVAMGGAGGAAGSALAMPEFWLVYLIGGVAGAIIALAFIKPLNLIEAIVRLALGGVFSVLLVNKGLDYLNLAHSLENVVLLGIAIGGLTWFVLGAIFTTAEKGKKGGLVQLIKDVLKK